MSSDSESNISEMNPMLGDSDMGSSQEQKSQLNDLISTLDKAKKSIVPDKEEHKGIGK